MFWLPRCFYNGAFLLPENKFLYSKSVTIFVFKYVNNEKQK